MNGFMILEGVGGAERGSTVVTVFCGGVVGVADGGCFTCYFGDWGWLAILFGFHCGDWAVEGSNDDSTIVIAGD